MTTRFTSFRPQVESLEERVVLFHKKIIIPLAAQDGFVLRFNESLDPGRAQDVANYSLQASIGGGFRNIAVRRATYDEANRQVTLLWRKPDWVSGSWTLRMVVKGNAPTGLVGLNGQLFDGDQNGQPGGDAEVQAKWVRNRRSNTHQTAWALFTATSTVRSVGGHRFNVPAVNGTLGLTEVKIP